MAEEGIVAGDVTDINPALQEVLKTIVIHDGLARGTHKAAKPLDKCQVHLCMLPSNSDEPLCQVGGGPLFLCCFFLLLLFFNISQWKQCQTLFLGAPKSLQMVTAAMKLKDAYSLEGKL